MPKFRNESIAFVIDSLFVLMGVVAIALDSEDAWVGGVAIFLAALDILWMGKDFGIPDAA